MQSSKLRLLIMVFFVFITTQSCTRNPFDSEASASFNRDEFTFQQILPTAPIRAFSVAGNTTGELGVVILNGDGEIIILNNAQGHWAELGRFLGSTSSATPLLDIAPDTNGFWFVLVSNDMNGVILYHTDGTVYSEHLVPMIGDNNWDDGYGRMEMTAAGNLAVVLKEPTQGLVLCVQTSDTWVYHMVPGTTGLAELLSYRTDSVSQHHILYRESSTAFSKYNCFSSDTWSGLLEVKSLYGASAGAPLKLSIPESDAVRAIGFEFERNVLVMREYVGTGNWDSETIPVKEDVLINRYLSVVTAPNGTANLIVARFNGMSRCDLLWLNRSAPKSWNVSTVAEGVHRSGQYNPVLMVMAGDVPHLVFAAPNSEGDQAVLWDVVAR